MLPKTQRLTRSFPIIFQKGAKIHTPFFVVRALPAWDEIPRLTVIVSKKAAKTAVKRNRIRRRLFAAAQMLEFPTCLAKPFRIAILGNTEVLIADFKSLTSELQFAFAKLEQWRFPPPPQTIPQDIGNK